MGERSQIYIKYNRDRLIAYQMKYADGPKLIDLLLSVADHRDDPEHIMIGEDILYWYFTDVHEKRKRLTDYSSIWNRGNQCGKLFVEFIPDGAVKYCFTDSEASYPPGKQKPLDADGYLEWSRTTYLGEPDWDYSQGLYNERMTGFSVMSSEELEEFIEGAYDMDGMYKRFLNSYYGA